MIFSLPAPPMPAFTPPGAHRHFHTGYIHIKRRFGPKNLQESLFFSQRRSAEKHRPSPSISPTRTTFVDIYPQKSARFSRAPLPIYRLRPSPRPLGERKHPSIFHITESGHFCGKLPSNIASPMPQSHPPWGVLLLRKSQWHVDFMLAEHYIIALPYTELKQEENRLHHAGKSRQHLGMDTIS